MRRKLYWLGVLALGCAGEPNAEPPVQQVKAAVMTSGSRVVWRDATGAVVPIIGGGVASDVGNNGPRTFFMVQDTVWALDVAFVEEGAPPYEVGAVSGGTTYYTSVDCSGPGYVDTFTGAAGARSTIVGSDGVIYRMPDDVPPVRRGDFHSEGTPSSCIGGPDTTIGATVVPISAMRVVTPPVNPFVFPIHPEIHND